MLFSFSKKLISFNPNAALPYMVIVDSPLTSKSEKLNALDKLAKIDPHQLQIQVVRNEVEKLP